MVWKKGLIMCEDELLLLRSEWCFCIIFVVVEYIRFFGRKEANSVHFDYGTLLLICFLLLSSCSQGLFQSKKCGNYIVTPPYYITSEKLDG